VRRGVQLREDAKLSLNYLSQALQIEVILHVHSKWLEAIWFVRDLEASVKVRIALSMAPRVIAPGEIAPPGSLYVLSRGKVMYGGRILSRGNWWGDDVILSDSRWMVRFLARAIVYTDVTSVSRETLRGIVETHPTSWYSLRRSTAALALRRAIVYEAKLRRQMLQQSPGAGRDFMDKVDDASKGLVATDEQDRSMTIALELSQVSSSTISPMGRGSSSAIPPMGQPPNGAHQATVRFPGRTSDASNPDGLERVMAALKEIGMGMETMNREITAIKDGQRSMEVQLAGIKPADLTTIRAAGEVQAAAPERMPERQAPVLPRRAELRHPLAGGGTHLP
jgi:hypothetical protein